MTDQPRIEPYKANKPKSPLNPLIQEAKMVTAWISTSIRMGLETLFRFGVRPPVTIFERQPGQFPDIGLVHRELSWLPERDAADRPSPEPFAIQARRPSARKSIKQFHAARHSED